MSKISIVTPTYNSSKFISRTITSVLNQSYTDWEFLIIDDNSTDNTTELIKKFASQDSRIKLLKTASNSGGPASPKNIGIKNSLGEYIAFLDHDDEWAKDKLSKQIEFFESEKDDKLGVVFNFVNIVNNDGKILSKYTKSYKGDVIKNLTNGNFIITSSCVMVKASIFKKVSFFDSNFKIFDDWDMWLRISREGFEFKFIPEYLTNYIVHGDNACRGNNSKNRQEFIALYEKHKDIFLFYNLKEVGLYYYYKKDYKLSRKYYIRHIFTRGVDINQKIISFVYIILSFFPFLEDFFKKIFLKIS